MSRKPEHVEFWALKGKTLASIKGLKEGSEEVVFVTTEGERFRMYHEQDCCESVSLVDVDGLDAVKFPAIVRDAECESFSPPSALMKDESETWTFYKITVGWRTCVLRWVGSSNGYYSESVSFVREPAVVEAP